MQRVFWAINVVTLLSHYIKKTKQNKKNTLQDNGTDCGLV